MGAAVRPALRPAGPEQPPVGLWHGPDAGSLLAERGGGAGHGAVRGGPAARPARRGLVLAGLPGHFLHGAVALPVRFQPDPPECTDRRLGHCPGTRLRHCLRVGAFQPGAHAAHDCGRRPHRGCHCLLNLAHECRNIPDVVRYSYPLPQRQPLHGGRQRRLPDQACLSFAQPDAGPGNGPAGPDRHAMAAARHGVPGPCRHPRRTGAAERHGHRRHDPRARPPGSQRPATPHA
ncbi:hypothetical protein G6F22_016823 [Rhizopus arrhizus]|nr:hypothetical protein G6F22_016823 [Rhizopus arrhizus]